MFAAVGVLRLQAAAFKRDSLVEVPGRPRFKRSISTCCGSSKSYAPLIFATDGHAVTRLQFRENQCRFQARDIKSISKQSPDAEEIINAPVFTVMARSPTVTVRV